MTHPRTPDPRNDDTSPVTELSGAEEDSGWDPEPKYAGVDFGRAPAADWHWPA